MLNPFSQSGVYKCGDQTRIIDPNLARLLAFPFIVHHLANMEMIEDDFIKFKEKYQQQIRQNSEKSDKPSDPDSQKGSGEGNENFLNENGGSNC